MVENKFTSFKPDAVALKPSLFRERFELNRRYVASLTAENLLHSHYMEAGLWQPTAKPHDFEHIHMGWEAPTSQVRGMFVGHWLSAAARIWATTGDPELKGRIDFILAELARCQRENGGEWIASIPEKYLHWIARGKDVWAPQYIVHKTLMGLFDVYALTGQAQALEMIEQQARWFTRWTAHISREQMDEILDYETGGLLEMWANLYGVTRKQEHLDLVYKYDRPRLFDRLLAGEDVLTNRHANTTIPEAQGAARAYEVTGDERWRKIALAYWRSAVTERGYFATGGQTSGEVWTPPFELAARLGDRTQEHCTVYNMTRLADYLLRWTGDSMYADYIERNLYNGTLAQQHPQTGMVTYYLPLRADGGARKAWGSPTQDFWCCHGTLVQAQTTHNAYAYYQDAEGLVVSQYIPTDLHWNWRGVPITISQNFDYESSSINSDKVTGAHHRPNHWLIDLRVTCAQPSEFALKFRIPWWTSGDATISVNGETRTISEHGYYAISHEWRDDQVRIELPKSLATCPLPDAPDTVAFMDGPVVLAGLVEDGRSLSGDLACPETILTPDYERQWGDWKPGYRTHGQAQNFRLTPLYEVGDEAYTVYFTKRI